MCGPALVDPRAAISHTCVGDFVYVYVGSLCVSLLAAAYRLPLCVSVIHSIQMRTALNGVELL